MRCVAGHGYGLAARQELWLAHVKPYSVFCSQRISLPHQVVWSLQLPHECKQGAKGVFDRTSRLRVR